MLLRRLLLLVCLFTMAACSWLFVMYFVLRHPGFEWRAALAAGIVVVTGLTAYAAVVTRPALGVRALAGVSAALIAALATSVLVQNHRPNAHFEGYAEIIGLALLAQGLLTIGWVIVRAAPTPPVRREDLG